MRWLGGYNRGSMTADGHIEKKPNKDGKKVETLSIEFTNGSLEQLKQLAKFFDITDNDPTEVVKLGISFMQNVKDRQESKAGKEKSE